MGRAAIARFEIALERPEPAARIASMARTARPEAHPVADDMTFGNARRGPWFGGDSPLARSRDREA